jgi:tetratricopeptide (TPR) repeat protein
VASDLCTGGLNAAEAAVGLVLTDPRAAQCAARAVLDSPGDPEAATVAHRALGLALADTDELAAAVRSLRRAIALAQRHGLPDREAQARLSLAGVLVRRGNTDAALRQLDAAALVAGRVDAARVAAQRGLVLSRAGHYEAALAAYRAALPVLRRAGDARFVALVLLNRGALRAWRGETTAATRDLRDCLRVARNSGLALLAADAANNLGYAAARAGDVPAALAAFDRAERMPGITPAQRAITWLDRAQTLLEARLATEAAGDVRRALAVLEPLGHGLDVGIGWLLLAEAALLAGEPAAARDAAGRAGTALRGQSGGPWPATAAHLHTAARLATGERGPEVRRAARADVRRMDRAGWPEPAARARILLAELLLAEHRGAAAAEVLAPAAAARARGPAGLRAAAWHAEALLRAARDDRAGALAAARSGLRVVAEHAASLGAADLRAHAAGHGVALAELGLGLTLDAGRPADALVWADRLRTRSLWRPALRPPADPVLARLLTRLRAAAEGGDAAAQVRLERAVQARARHSRGRTDRGGPEPARLRETLGRRALVCYLRRAGRLLAISLVAGRHRVHDLGPWAPAAAELDWLRFACHRLCAHPDSVPARGGLAHSVAALDAVLLRPLPDLTDRPLLVLPTAELHALPWAMLPSLRGRAVEVAPSLRLWCTAARAAPAARGPVLLAAGPGLRHAGREVAALARLHPDARVLRGAAAGVDAVLAGMDGAAVAHLACHGRFRADNPQFSALSLADGPLTVHDLDRLTRPPRLLLLSACEAARTAALPGDALLGLAAALCGLGTRTLIAPVLPVADAGSRALMVDLHRRLLAGTGPAAALAAASAGADVAGFVCVGAG